MDYYTLDIFNPRVQRAMMNLGIEEEELIQKQLEDFDSREISNEIRQLRFNYFQRKQQELVRQIKTFMREDFLRNREKKIQSNKSHSPNNVLITSVIDTPKSESLKTKDTFKKIVDKTYFDLRDAFLDKKAIEDKIKIVEKNRKKVRSAVSKNRVKLEEFKEKQKENLEKIKKIERKKEKVLARNSNSASPKRFRNKNRPYEVQSRSGSIDELEIGQQISKYEEKMNKSKVLHDLIVQTKRNAVSKLLERNKKSKSSHQDFNIVEKIQKIVLKSKTAQDRRSIYLKQQAESREKSKERHEERVQKAQNKLKEQIEIEKKKGKAFERKMKISSSLLQQKHENWVKELEIRSEMQRLRDEEALNNAERKKRIMKVKREGVLEKQISDSQRIEAIKKNKEEGVKRKLENAMRTMKEKEKLHEVLAYIKKTPESRIMGRKHEKFLESLYSF